MILSKADLTDAALSAELDAIARKMKFGSLDEALHFPRFVQLETTRLCNARCPMCPVDEWDKTTRFMADDLFEKLADEICEYADWLRWVCIQKAGEPLLDKKIGPRIKRLKDGGVGCVTMSTNASGLNERKGRELLEAGLDELMISFDATDRETYAKIRVGLDYDRVLANIRTFFRLRDDLRPETIIRVKGVFFGSRSEPDRKAEIAEWETFWAGLKGPRDRIYMKPAHSWGNQMTWDGLPPEFDGDVFHPCILPWSTIQITAMGTIALCPHDYDGIYGLGDVTQRPIAEVWRDTALARIRQLHATGQRNEIPLCRGCVTYDEEFSLEKEKPDLFASQSAA